MRLALLAPTLVAGLLLAAACVGEEAVETEDIVSAIPWANEERAEYVLLDRDGAEERGRGVIGVTRRGDQFELRLRFDHEAASDESVALVDAVTLKPISVRREFRDGDETTTISATYDPEEEVVHIVEASDGGERAVPRRLEEHYYDNESSLFLWRTIPFRLGYEAAYHTVLTNQATQPLVTLKVVAKQEVTVPAGTFQAWLVEISSEGRRQVAWYADTPAHPLVQYDNTLQLFQLTALDGG